MSSARKIVALPPSVFWTPAQAIAAAASLPYVEVAVIGFSEDGEPLLRHSRIRPEHLQWLAEQLIDYAKEM